MFLKAAFLVLAGIAAGLGGSVAGVASIFSYPALLLIGLNPIDANVTNSVSLTFLSIGSITSSKREWLPEKKVLRILGPATLFGGITGSILLLITSVGTFKKIIPFLLIGASIAILIPQRERKLESKHKFILWILALSIGTYCGYFGAASGSLTIALLMQMLSFNIVTAHAVKNVLLGIGNGVAAAIFIFSHHVHWLPAIPLAFGFFVGGRLGPVIVRRSNPKAIKTLVSVMGALVGTWLLIKSV